MRQIVLISGHLCTGKSGLARALSEQYGYFVVKVASKLKELAAQAKLPNDKLTLRQIGDDIETGSQGKWVYDYYHSECENLPESTPVVIDNIRTRKQLEHFRALRSCEVIHVHLYASGSERLERYRSRQERGKADSTTYEAADTIQDEADIESFKGDADVRIFTNRSNKEDTLARVAARLGLYSPPDTKCVDVIVGGQYGSEGKGHVAAYLAREYDILIRVGGPNAGHTVSGPTGVYTYHQLPSGSKDTSAKLLLGPGMTINVSQLLSEISDCGISNDRLFIDPQAMIIEEEDIKAEQELVDNISSTGQGGGRAAARRITNRGKGVRLAKDIPELRPYVGAAPNYRGSTSRQLEIAYKQRKSILLEGTQGSGLSIFHGPYPHVTSRDTNVAGCLAEAGISPNRVRRILMVIRPQPIRVKDGKNGTSGPLKHETTFVQVATEAGLNPDQIVNNELTSTTKKPRRVGWFEWEQFRSACSLNAPTDIVLTFADYLDAGNQAARRFEQLTTETIKFIEEIERVAQAPVSLINTRFPREVDEKIDLRTIIDRRNWRGCGGENNQ